MKKCFIIIFILIGIMVFPAEEVDKEKVLENKQWGLAYMTYEPDDSYLETLKEKVGNNLKIDVYLGLWCSDSKRNVPLFVKIIDRIDSAVPVRYFTVERKPTPETKYFVTEFKVERVPTFIFYRAGKEIGRITENPMNSMLEDFLEIVF